MTIKYQTDYFSVCTSADGDDYLASSGDEVLIVPLTPDGDVLLTLEPAPAFNELVLVLPGGEVSPGEPHAEAANRELQEEIGYRAGRLDFLGELRPWSKYLAVRSHLFLARDLTPSWLAGDEDYEIGVQRVPLDRFETLIASGRLTDARVIAALYLARDYAANSNAGTQTG